MLVIHTFGSMRMDHTKRRDRKTPKGTYGGRYGLVEINSKLRF